MTNKKNSYVSLSTAVLLILLIGCSSTQFTKGPSGNVQNGYLTSELPDIIIAYSLYCSQINKFKKLDEDKTNPLIKLDQNMKKLGVGVCTGLAFTHMSYIVQNDLAGSVYGFNRKEGMTLDGSHVPYENIIYVTSPIKSFDGKVLLILSSISPDRTTIVAVNKNLDTDLLFDSFAKNNITETASSTTFGSVYNVSVKRPGLFILQERMEPGTRGYSSQYENRSFIIDLTGGIFKIMLQQ